MTFNKFPEISIKSSNFQEDVKPLISKIRPNWNLNRLKIKKQTGGVSNVLFSVSNSDEVVKPGDTKDKILVRVYGEMLVNRALEMENMSALSQFGLAARVNGQFLNGCSYQFIFGSVLNIEDSLKPEYQTLIIKEMVKLHKVKLNLNRSLKPFIFEKCREFGNILPDNLSNIYKNERYRKEFPSKEEYFSEIFEMEKYWQSQNAPVAFCHNDLLMRNLILNRTETRIHFIDFEYADYNYTAFDIGNHFNEFAGLDIIDYSLYPSKEFQMQWLKEYLTELNQYQAHHAQESLLTNGHICTDKNTSSISVESATHPANLQQWYEWANRGSLVSHLLWSAWSIYQQLNSEIDFDYLDYGITRWTEYKRRKSIITNSTA